MGNPNRMILVPSAIIYLVSSPTIPLFSFLDVLDLSLPFGMPITERETMMLKERGHGQALGVGKDGLVEGWCQDRARLTAETRVVDWCYYR